jgi:diacylglycerol O-acyltransferase
MTHDSAMTSVEDCGEPPTPTRPSWRGRLSRLGRRRDGRAPLMLELAIIAWLFWLYDVINNLAPTRVALARTDARGLLAFERSLGLNVERTLNRWLSSHAVLSFIATYYYFFAHVIVTFSVLAWLWWSRPDIYRRLRAPLVLINLIAFAVFWRYPLAPPRMLAGLGYRDVVASTHAVISWDSGALVHDADQLAAMPSLHVAWASWSALAVWQLVRRRLVRALVVLYPFLTGVIVIATGNHWLMDVLAGAATFLFSLALAAVLAWVGWGRRHHLALPELADIAAQGLGVPTGGQGAISERFAQRTSGPT